MNDDFDDDLEFGIGDRENDPDRVKILTNPPPTSLYATDDEVGYISIDSNARQREMEARFLETAKVAVAYGDARDPRVHVYRLQIAAVESGLPLRLHRHRQNDQ